MGKTVQICNSIVTTHKLLTFLSKAKKTENIKYIKDFIQEYYSQDNLPDNFYNALLLKIRNTNCRQLFKTLSTRNIYQLIRYLKNDEKTIPEIEEIITPSQYYQAPKKHINRIIELLKGLETKNESNAVNKTLKDEFIWCVKRNPNFEEDEYTKLAYKMYFSIGLDNTTELLEKKYGEITYEHVHFLFSELDVKKTLAESEHRSFIRFLFDNKKDYNNTIRQMLNGGFPNLFLNFDYFYNRFPYFVNRLGTKMPKDKVNALLKDRYLSYDTTTPEITRDILDDMTSSYYCKYESLDTLPEEIYKKNFDAYNEYLRKKYKSSIPKINLPKQDEISCEILKLNDPRALVLGYRSGNCFRINGDAAILFKNFLRSEHMRLLSVSTKEHKDYAMMLIMRNGNVLIGQGIEVSNRVSPDIKGENLYNACRTAMKKIMEYMNCHEDEIVATIIGSSNSNVSKYNEQILPFLISPILENQNNYYNGIYNYQCLLDVAEGKSLKDIKLFIPTIRYYDERAPILSRTKESPAGSNDYLEVEKRLIALRFCRAQQTHDYKFYETLSNHQELYTCCNQDWYITLFSDGTVDGFISESGDIRTKKEYDSEMSKVYQKSKKTYVNR